MYLIRLDDASDKRDVDKWNKIEEILDKYSIKPLVGVIPENKDPLMQKYPSDSNFWNLVKKWENKGWVIAMHGCFHVYTTDCGGINPINNRSEFAGESLENQEIKIKHAKTIFSEHFIEPRIFFAPSHTFDINTIEALKKHTTIKIISDTIANKAYYKYGVTFIPQQSGMVRKLPFKMVTFCYHPNIMTEDDFVHLEKFIINNRENFEDFPIIETKRKKSLYDWLLEKIYFAKRRKRHGRN